MSRVQIDRPASHDAVPLIEPLLEEYMGWIVEQLAEIGVPFDDPAAQLDVHRAMFRAEAPKLLGPRGRLFVARVDGATAGVGALKPVDAHTAEIKRMYVRPEHQGHGIGRRILQRLLADARALGYRSARLETAKFMTEAQGLHRSFGFVDIPAFDHSETADWDADGVIVYMQLSLGDACS